MEHHKFSKNTSRTDEAILEAMECVKMGRLKVPFYRLTGTPRRKRPDFSLLQRNRWNSVIRLRHETAFLCQGKARIVWDIMIYLEHKPIRLKIPRPFNYYNTKIWTLVPILTRINYLTALGV